MLLAIIILVLLDTNPIFAKPQYNNQQRQSSFTRYVEYAETPASRPSYFSVPYRIPPNNELHYIADEIFSNLIREHVRHQQRVRILHQNRQPQVYTTQEPILRGVSRITELRQTPFQRFSHNYTALTYEEKRRRWKEDLKKRMRANKQPPREMGSGNPVGTAGRYYITFNPYSNAYQVSRRLPSYVRKENIEPEVTPDSLLPTVTTITTSTTHAPVIVRQQAEEIAVDVEQLIRIPSAPKLKTPSVRRPIKQILNLDYYDDEFEPEEQEETTTSSTTQLPTTTRLITSTTQLPTTTTRLVTSTTQLPTTTTTTRPPQTTQRPIVYPPTTRATAPPTHIYWPAPTSTVKPTQRSSLFSSYEDDEQASDDEDDSEEFIWFKPGADGRKVQPNAPTEDPFRIIVHSNQPAV